MKISIASDHGGFDLKEAIKNQLNQQNGIELIDVGTHTKDSCDYPDYGQEAANLVAQGETEYGILVCTTGIGMSITANRIKNIRAALCTSTKLAEMGRRHNNANILALGDINQDEKKALEIVNTFLTTDFEGGRHARRVKKIEEFDKKQ